METIIGLLFILLPVILKVIGNRLEQSGKTATAEKMRRFAQSLDGDDDGDEAEPFTVNDAEPEPAEETVKKPAVLPEPVARIVQMPKRPVARHTSAILLEKEEKTVREKIDPKKLVVYSEIMQPKYKDN